MKLPAFLIIFFSISWNLLTSQNFPTYGEVLKTFFSKYSTRELGENHRIKFEKKPEGWFASVHDMATDDKILKRSPVWLVRKKKFVKASFPKLKKGETAFNWEKEYFNAWDRSQFYISPFYGYPGWEYDVISVFGKKTDLSDTILYALGRAYSAAASNLLHNNSGLSDGSRRFVIGNGPDALSKEQLETYRSFSHNAISCFEKLKDRNPAFKTIVGSIGVKWANEFMTSFLELRTLQNEAEAQKELREGIYNGFYLSLARNFLAGLDSNAVLFTNGDNDTYPLLYVQSAQNFRTDVLVVNISLLQTCPYILRHTKPVMKAKGLELGLSPDEFCSENWDLVLVQNSFKTPLELEKLFSFMREPGNMIKYGDQNYHIIPGQKIMFRADSLLPSMTWTLRKPYLFKNQILILDIIRENKFRRPIYFSVTMGDDFFTGMEEYLWLEGLAFRLLPSGTGIPSDYPDGVIAPVIYRNLMEKFSYAGLEAAYPSEKNMLAVYRYIHGSAAMQLIDEGKKDSAVKVLDKIMTLLPDNVCPLDIQALKIIEGYYAAGSYEKGNRVAEKLIYNLKNPGVYLDSPPDKDFSSRILITVRELAREHDQNKILELIDP